MDVSDGLLILALLFTAMKPGVEALFEKYGTESPPPAPQVFTVPSHPGNGNMHFVQKVFEGAFEFDIIFESGSATLPVTCKFDESTSFSGPCHVWQNWILIFIAQPTP